MRTDNRFIKIKTKILLIIALGMVGILTLFWLSKEVSHHIFLGQVGVSLPYTILSIPDKYKVVSPGEDLVIQIRLFNFGTKEKIDIVLDYEIKDSEDNTVLVQHETVAVHTQASFLKTFGLPCDIEPGDYTVFSRLKSLEGESFTTASTSFEISKSHYPYIRSQTAWRFSKNSFIAIASILFIFVTGFFLVNSIKQKPEKRIETIQKKATYLDLINAIIDSNYFFLGDKAIKEANKISGLKVSEDGKVLKLEEDPQDVILRLVNLYRISIGEGSVNIAREAIQPILRNNPYLKVPFGLNNK